MTSVALRKPLERAAKRGEVKFAFCEFQAGGFGVHLATGPTVTLI